MAMSHGCAWCGADVAHEHEQESNLCTECQETYQTESHRSLHPVEERQPHHD